MRAEPWGLVRTDHGSSTIRCTPSCNECARLQSSEIICFTEIFVSQENQQNQHTPFETSTANATAVKHSM